jgi:hypothetical protein
VEAGRHFWNGRWGRLARHGALREDAGRGQVEDRRGGAEGKSGRFEYDNEDAAVERIRMLMTDGWREISARLQ